MDLAVRVSVIETEIHYLAHIKEEVGVTLYKSLAISAVVCVIIS